MNTIKKFDFGTNGYYAQDELEIAVRALKAAYAVKCSGNCAASNVIVSPLNLLFDAKRSALKAEFLAHPDYDTMEEGLEAEYIALRAPVSAIFQAALKAFKDELTQGIATAEAECSAKQTAPGARLNRKED